MLEVDQIKRNKTETEYATKELEEHKKIVERGKSLERLMKNRDFKKLILDDFMGTNAANSAQLSVDLKMPEEQRKAALAMAQASGYLLQHLTTVSQQAYVSEGKVVQYEELLVEIRNEDLEQEG